MRVRGLALLGLVVGAFVGLSSPAAATAVSSSSSSSLTKLFSSDGPESLHEAKNQGTMDEPKAWPEATAWLHAQLTDAERDFLALVGTGTVDPTASASGSFTAQQVADTTGSVDASVRVNLGSLPANFLTNFKAQIITALNGLATTNSVSTPTPTPIVIGTTLMTVISFRFSNAPTATAVAQWQAFAAQFKNPASVLRNTASSTSFADLDLSFFPSGTFVTAAPTTAPTTTAPTGGASTATPTTPQPCAASATPCLNGGTCINGASVNGAPSTSYTCSCAAGFIGSKCEFSLFGSRRSAHTQGAVPRGKSVTRPNAMAKSAAAAVKPHSA